MSKCVTFHLRDATERDIPAIAGLLNALNQFEGVDVVTDVNKLRQALFAPVCEVVLTALVAEYVNGVVATLLYYPGYDTASASYGYHLADMVVDEAYRRGGIGRALVHALASRALKQGKEWISLTALSRNDVAKKFYQSLGMTRVEVDFFAIGKRGLTQL